MQAITRSSRAKPMLVSVVAAAVLFTSCATGSEEPSSTPHNSDGLRAMIAGYSRPDGDVQFVLQEIERRIADCMTAQGFDDWVTTNVPVSEMAQQFSLAIAGLPAIVVEDGQAAGYADPPRNHTDEETPELSPAASEDAGSVGEPAPSDVREAATVDALLGPPGGESVSYRVPGAGVLEQDLGGCKGVGYAAVLEQDEMPGFLAAEFLMLNLPSAIASKALQRTEGIEEWSGCMARIGLSFRTPFAPVVAGDSAGSHEVVAQDYACRTEMDLEAAYAAAVDAELAAAPREMAAALGELEQTAAAARARLEIDQ